MRVLTRVPHMLCQTDLSREITIPATHLSMLIGKVTGKEAYSVPYGITEYYLPPGRGDIPDFTPAN